MQAVYSDQARIFKAFCDENRLRILAMLRGGDLCACVLIERLGIKQPALSYHMKVLLAAGVVESWPEGKWTHYRISEAGCQAARELLGEITAVEAQSAVGCACEGR